jgi:hypothetical protein
MTWKWTALYGMSAWCLVEVPYLELQLDWWALELVQDVTFQLL